MALREIPVGSDIEKFKTELDGINYEYRFIFNDRTQLWGMDIFDDTGELLLGGVPMLVNQDILDKYRNDKRLPQGTLFITNLVEENVDPGRDNFGTDVILFYQDVE